MNALCKQTTSSVDNLSVRPATSDNLFCPRDNSSHSLYYPTTPIMAAAARTIRIGYVPGTLSFSFRGLTTLVV